MSRIKGDPSCTRCPLHKTCNTVCLMGVGPVPCEVMVIGEAPGVTEDEEGKPFVGDSGRLLNRMLKAAGIKRRKVYITNTVKCRPPGNRTPKVAEMRACSVWLQKEIEMVKPKYILLLGATPLKAVLNLTGIKKIRGQPIEKDGIIYFPTYHPSYALRNPKEAEVIETDLKVFRGIVKRGGVLPSSDANWSIVYSLDDFHKMVEEISESKWVALDLETQGLNPFDPSKKIVCIALGTRDKQWIVPLAHKESPFKKPKLQGLVVEIIADLLKTKKVIAHNGKFDSLWLRVKFGVDIKIHFDTMLADYLLNEEHPHSLEYLASLYFGAPNYDIPVEEKQGNGPLQRLAKYAALDVYYTYRLKNYLLKRLKADDDQALYKLFRHLMMPASQMYTDVEYNGVYLDKKALEEANEYLEKEMAAVKKELDKFKKGLNCNSPQQIAAYLFGDLGLDPLEKTKTGQPSTSKDILKRLQGKHESIPLILKYKELAKMKTFINSWTGFLVGDRMHPTFKLHVAVTGRTSCADPNLQQVPRNKKIRSIITAPPGWTFVEADQSQIELRIAAALSGDPTMKRIFQTGGDIHTSTAESLLGRKVKDKEERKMAKAVNFGLLYGMGYKKFQKYAADKYDVHFTLEEAKRYRERFFETYSGLRPWHDRQRRIVRRLGYVRCLDGRIRHLPGIFSEDEKERAQAERQAINSPVQGLASDITLMGAIDLWRKFPRDRFRIVGTVHDSILMEVKDEHLEEILPEIKKTMEDPPTLRKLGVKLTVPLVADISVGPWGSGIEWEEDAV